MKKTVALFLISIGFVACDDGDLVFENLNFDDQNIEKCEENELYFKIKNNELLLVDFSATSNGEPTSILDTLAPLNDVQELPTGNQTKIYYRTYDGAVSKNSICSLLAPANPKVTSEYTSISGGTIKYIRTLTPVVTETSVNITHAYTINFENITLSNGTSDIRYTTLPYGTYVYELNKMSFNFNNFNNCDNVLTGNTSNEILQLDLPEGFVFPEGNQTQSINLSTNLLKYLVYKKTFSIDDAQPCELPSGNYIKENWEAESGTLQVESSEITNAAGNITGYKHILRIVQAQFKKDNSTFVIKDKILGTYAPQE